MLSSMKVGIAALALGATAVTCAQQQIQVQVDGQPVYFTNAQPQYLNGRVLVPLRGVFEQMGATVMWHPGTRTVTANKGEDQVELTIGNRSASVNGRMVTLDVPAMVVNGSTMVPIRFVSESLGADVGWQSARNLVTINTNGINSGSSTIYNPPQTMRRVLISENEVLPVTLDQSLSTINNARGDTFTATIETGKYNGYNDIPRGTKIEGHIAALHRKNNARPAILDLQFDRIRFPNGRTAKIDGTLTSLDSKYVRENNKGVLMSRNNSNTDHRMVYAGYGAGAGLLVGVLTKRPLEGTILGGALGYILGQVEKDKQKETTDVTLDAGTDFGVQINRDITASW